MIAIRALVPSQADVDAGYILLARLLWVLVAVRGWYLVWRHIRHEPLITLNVQDRGTDGADAFNATQP